MKPPPGAFALREAEARCGRQKRSDLDKKASNETCWPLPIDYCEATSVIGAADPIPFVENRSGHWSEASNGTMWVHVNSETGTFAAVRPAVSLAGRWECAHGCNA